MKSKSRGRQYHYYQASRPSSCQNTNHIRSHQTRYYMQLQIFFVHQQKTLPGTISPAPALLITYTTLLKTPSKKNPSIFLMSSSPQMFCRRRIAQLSCDCCCFLSSTVLLLMLSSSSPVDFVLSKSLSSLSAIEPEVVFLVLSGSMLQCIVVDVTAILFLELFMQSIVLWNSNNKIYDRRSYGFSSSFTD